MFKKFFQLINKRSAPVETPAVSATITTEVPEKVSGIPYFAPVKGLVKNISEALDSSYANQQLGDGIFILPTDHKIYAPCDCEIAFIFPANHALGLRTKDGIELLLSLEMDNSSTQEAGFTLAVDEDQDVKKGTLLGEFDPNYTEGNTHPARIHLIATNLEETQHLTTGENKNVTLEDIIFEIA